MTNQRQDWVDDLSEDCDNLSGWSTPLATFVVIALPTWIKQNNSLYNCNAFYIVYDYLQYQKRILFVPENGNCLSIYVIINTNASTLKKEFGTLATKNRSVTNFIERNDRFYRAFYHKKDLSIAIIKLALKMLSFLLFGISYHRHF